jgi:hypothetical protein
MQKNLFALHKINVLQKISSLFPLNSPLIVLCVLYLVAPATSTFSQKQEILDNYYNTSSDFNLSTTEFSPNSSLGENVTNSQFKIVSLFFVSLIFIPITICTIVGNMLVVLAVVIVRKLHTQDNANNFLIVSLAVSDFLVGVMVMPFHVYLELSPENK